MIESRTPANPWLAIVDPSNPFRVDGLAHEVKTLLRYIEDAKVATGLDVVVTCTTDHPVRTASGGISLHRAAGTDGEGRAIDARMRTRGLDVHRNVFELFAPVEELLAELIYADPPEAERADGSFGPYNVKNGRRVKPFAVSSHHDHVHVAVPAGVLIAYATTPEEAHAMFPAAGFALVADPARQRDPSTGLVAFYTWLEDGSVFAWNGAPGPVPNDAGKAAIRADAAGPVRSLLPLADGTFVLVAGEPLPGSRWRTYRNVDLDPAHRS